MKKSLYIYSFLFFIFLTSAFLLLIIAMQQKTSVNVIPRQTILLTGLFDDVNWLAKKAEDDLAKRISNETEREQFVSLAKKLPKNIAVEENGSCKLSTTMIINLKELINEFDKIVEKVSREAKPKDQVFFKSYQDRIMQVNSKVSALEILAA